MRLRNRGGKFQHRKIRVAGARVLAWVAKFVIYCTGVCLILGTSFCAILLAVVCIETQQVWNIVQDFDYILEWYCVKDHNPSGYVPAIVVASASLLLTVITIYQSHYSRTQDRVMDFPGNYLNSVSIGLEKRKNLKLTRKYFDPIAADSMIEFSFKESFSSYYKAYPYRLFAHLDKGVHGKDDEWEEIKIGNFHYSNILDRNPADYEMLVEGSASRLLWEYCHKTQANEDYRLELIFDIDWSNNLMPWWNRKFADIYMRERIQLERQKNKPDKDNTFLFENNYRVYYTEHEHAPLASWILLGKCIRTDLRQKKHAKERAQAGK